MQRSIKNVLPVVILVTSLNAGGFALSGVGARALSMGGAFRAIANDWSAVYWNPAGVSYLTETQIALNGIAVGPRSSFEPNTGILGYDGPYSLREKVNSVPQNFYIPAFVYVTPFEIAESRVAISFTVPFGLGSKWDLYDFPIGYYNTTDTSFHIPEYEKHDWQSNLSIYNMYLSYGKAFGPLMVGISGGVTLTNIMLRKVNFLDPATIDPSLTSLPIQYRLFPIDTKIEGTGWGLGGNIGVLWNLSDKLKMGASARLYSKINIEGTADLVLYFPYNDYLLSQVPPEAQFIFNGSTASGSGGLKTTLNLPMNFGAGLSYKLTETLLLALDVDWTRWFTMDRLGVDFQNLVLKIGGMIPLDTLKTDTLNFLWNNTYRVSIGAEYALFPNLFLRAGAYWDQSPVPATTTTVLIPDPGEKYSINLGIGYIMKNVELNLNYEYLLPVSHEVERGESYSYKSDYLPGKYSMFINALGLNVNFKF
ncbi:MAG TPA: outer membrane protein transport protein [Candidatus Hydrothermia bacterium]|nr:outer membrane protein transport protein [Candidatus Hydrothermia bacterium]MDD5572514.1 outer membrane protein transport protein [Candidatus Hydrothermia bacterium]HOK22528.1 outer membrane protein transport protein [Candidatus Hydrothermia bacterium]HOL23235.1 outer membrane protein transport protein [Candidatus Hydrothermia bacterium]HOP32579.1 outer membrane protein transport protein [Candidatus Hydrothermia bacterium]